MKHSFAATNPCHVYDLALALHEKEALGMYYSGYPGWRLKPPEGFPLKTASFRTLVTYGMQRLPESLRIEDEWMFRWQDEGFDRAISRKLEGEGFIHGLPGQCLRIFREARKKGMRTVLNHASGPLKQQRALVAPEYARRGVDLEAEAPLPGHVIDRLEEEMALAEFHCVASTVVRDQLIADGVDAGTIWVVPYGADPKLFTKRNDVPTGPYKICFAGRQSLRKGIIYLLQALEEVGEADWELHCFGMPFGETAQDFEAYSGKSGIIQHGSVSQAEFGKALHDMDVLVLPSAEEAFGLVVVQALETGVPCVVSHRVGAKDLIREGETGSVFSFGDVKDLAKALKFWSGRRITVEDRYPWASCSDELISLSETA